MLAVKRKSPHVLEGFKTWCGLLCDYRTTFLENKKYLYDVTFDFLRSEQMSKKLKKSPKLMRDMPEYRDHA